MEALKVAQLYNMRVTLKEDALELLNLVDIDYCIPDTHPTYPGYTALHFAASLRASDLTNELLQQGADLLKQGKHDGCTPIHMAISKPLNIKYIRCLLHEKSFINTLLSKQIESNNILNPANKYGLTHLHIACMVNHPQAVEFFAQANVSLDQSISYEPDDDSNNELSIDQDKYTHMKQFQGYTPLHYAVKYSSVEAAAILLQYGADIYAKNADGMSCVHLLVELVMNINDFITMGTRTPCMPYLENMLKPVEAIIELVLKTRASDEIFLDDMGFSVLHLACTIRDISIVEDLLKKNSDVNMSVSSVSKLWPGWTPLHFAACSDIEIMVLLLETGADITIKNSERETALDLCAKRLNSIDVQLIIWSMNNYRDILLSDHETKLLDLLLAMDDYDKFNGFLQKLDFVNLIVPLDSPIWPGYTLLHLCVSFNEKNILWSNFEKKLQLLEIADEEALKMNNCTVKEEALYKERIDLCLHYGCSVDWLNAEGQSPIHLAFNSFREPIIVRKLLSYSYDNLVNPNNVSHLHVACAMGPMHVVKRYLDRGAYINSRMKIHFNGNKDRWIESKVPIELRVNSTPLHIAVVMRLQNLVEYLLSNSAYIYATDWLGLTPIHLMVMHITGNNLSNVAELLFTATPNLQDCISDDGLSHLHVAAYTNNKEVVRRLLREGAEVDCVVNANVKQPPFLARLAGKTPLRVAEDESAKKAIKALLEKGANVHAEDLEGVSALQYMFKHIDMDWTEPFIEMLKHGKCDAEPSGLTLLHVACGTYDVNWVAELLEKGADVNARISVKGGMKGVTPLHMVFEPSTLFRISQSGVIDKLVELLLRKGADVTATTCQGLTPLLLAYVRISEYILSNEDCDEQEKDHDGDEPMDYLETTEMEYILEAIDLLLDGQKSYDINPTHAEGFSHFHFACIRNKVQIVKKFLDHGVDVNQSVDPFAIENAGLTPLHFALAHGNKEVAYLLLERGADVNAEDGNGNKPLHAAIKKNFVDLPLFGTMLRNGADIDAKNVMKKSLFDCLLKSGAATFQALDFFLVNGCSIDIQENITDFIRLLMPNLEEYNWQHLFKKLMQVPNVKEAIQNGFNMIQSLAAIKQNSELSVDNYFMTIEFIVSAGFTLDQQDAQGKTALHTAVSVYNLEAIDALLQLGANLNIVDNFNECPLSEKVIAAAKASDDPRAMDVVKILAGHIWKMKFVGLNVNYSNLRCLEVVEQKVLFTELTKPCLKEVMTAEKTRINEYLSLKDFLSEVDVILKKRQMNANSRCNIDSVFDCNDLFEEKFPLLRGILTLQYRKLSKHLKLLPGRK